MSLNPMFRLSIAMLAVLLGAPAGASELTLNAVQYPERRSVKVDFASTALASKAELSAKVKLKEGQAEIELAFDHLRPAVLYGGDVTSYVLWAVTRDGKVENLGELWAREEKDRSRFATGLKSFTLLVTAEPYPLVDRPSDMVLFYSLAAKNRRARSEAFAFSSFAAAPVFEVTNIDNYSYVGEVPLDLLQAEKAYEIAHRQNASSYAPDVMQEARTALVQARNLSSNSGRARAMLDYSRRSVALSSEALRVTARAVEGERLAAQEARRRGQIDELAGRTFEAEAATRQADAERRQAEAERRGAVGDRRQAEAELRGAVGDRRRADAARVEAEAQRAGMSVTVEQMRRDLAAMRAEREELSDSISSLERTRTDLEGNVTTLEQEKGALARQRAELAERAADLEGETRALAADKADLEVRAGGLEEEKAELAQRLEGALSSVAETRGSARGFIINLPDILFDVDQATLKPQAQLALAKLSGILALMPKLNLRIEGHTDSTGSAAHNLDLSQDRARSVSDFLDRQALDPTRMATFGYGLARPIADNATRDGRASNRRVEIVIAEGEVGEDPRFSSLR